MNKTDSPTDSHARLASSKMLSPERNTTNATSVDELVAGQLAHFGNHADSQFATLVEQIAKR